MASVDVKWPSEDEDFDTKNANQGGNVAVQDPPANGEQPSLSPQTDQAAAASSEAPSAPAETAEEAPEADKPDNKPGAVVAPSDDKPTDTPAAATATAGGSHKGNLLHIVVHALLLLAVIGLAVWGLGLQSKNKDLQKQVDTLNANPAIVEQRKTDELVSKVGALMEVPKDERPQAALVSDAESLKKQYAFFGTAQNGDQILFYYKAGKVIVYRPSTNKIVQSGPLTIQQQQAAAPATGTQSTNTRR